MNEQRARELVARERARIEALLADVDSKIRSDASLRGQQTGEAEESGTALDTASADLALAADLHERLEAVARAEERIAAGRYGWSIESGVPIPDERLEVEPLAERTVEEQRAFERG